MTGGAGFVESHLVDQIVRRGDSVIILDDFSTGRVENISHHIGNPRVTVVEGSVLDVSLTEKLVSGVERVFHLADAVGVFNIIRYPLESLNINIRGSQSIFDACLKFEKPVLITSSSEVYGKNSSDQLNENSDRVIGPPQKFRWSYSDAKAIDEAIAIALNKQKGLETRIVRLFNTVGPRQVGSYGMVVPRFVQAVLCNQPLTIYGSGTQTRCFGHVIDVVNAILDIDMHEEAIGKPVNIGVSVEISISSLANFIIEKTQSSSSIEYIPYDQAYENGFEDMARRVPDTSLLQQIIGWRPEKDLDAIVSDLIKSIKQSK